MKRAGVKRAGVQRAVVLLALTLAQSSARAPSAAAAAGRSQPRPSILLITVDTLRPDALGWVAGRNATPALDRLALEGARFPHAVSPVPLTGPAHVSLLTGLLPRRHGVRDNGQVFAAAVGTLAERLRQHGYATAAFVSGYPLQRFLGLDRGFDHYDDTLPLGDEGWLERAATDTTLAALAWVQTRHPAVPGAAPASPFFAWVHYYDPHDPYTPPRAFWQPGVRGAYDGEVAYVDDAIGKLRQGLAGHANDLLTVMTADHGEGLGEHQEHTHGYFVYDSTVLVPLVFHWPGHLQPRAFDLSARLIDVAPTILELAGGPPLANVDGTSLARLLDGRPAAVVAPAVIETQLPWIYFGWSPLTAIRDHRYKLIAAPRPELYDLQTDPGEASSLDARTHAEARRLYRELQRHERLAGPPPAAAPAAADDEVLARLRALGYLGAGSATNQRPPTDLADPKDRIVERGLLTEAERLLRGGRGDQALRLLEEVLARDPGNRAATLRSGIALLKLGRTDAAVTRLERSVALDPERAEARFALGDALTRTRRWRAAAAQWAELARLQPTRFEAWANLGAALLADGRPVEARQALERATGLRPTDLLTRARWQLASGQTAEAAATLGQALAADPALRAQLAQDPSLASLLPPP